MIEAERHYDVVITGGGVMGIVIDARGREPAMPRLLYDRGAHAFLYRNSDDVVLLDHIHPATRASLAVVPWTIVVEVDKDDREVRSYEVPVKVVKQLPETILMHL